MPSNRTVLASDDFYRQVRAGLQSGGVFAANLAPASEQALLEVLLPLRASLPYTLLSEIGSHGNVVVIASANPPAALDTLIERAESLSAELGVDLVTPARAFRYLPAAASIAAEVPA